MKIIKIISRISQLGLLLIVLGIAGCDEGAPLNIDPIQKDTLFTFVPDHGYPGTTVKITGNVVSGVTQVAFGSREGTISSASEGEVNVVVPVGATTGKIKLVKDGIVVTSLVNFEVDDTPIPTIMEMTPEIVGSQDTVLLTGSLLDLVDSVFIGSLQATVLSQSAIAIEIVTPKKMQTDFINLYYDYMTSYGIQKVGVAKSNTVLTLELPVIESIEPDISLLDIGDTLTLTGTMFDEVRKIFFGDVEAEDFEIISDTELKVVVPEGAVSGKIILMVIDGDTESVESFAINLPSISSFLPLKGGDISPTDRVFSVIGTNFSLVESVSMGTFTGTIQAQTNTHLTFSISGAAGGFLQLNTANGPVKSAIPFILYGDFWLADYDNMYDPVRLFNEPMYAGVPNSEQWADITVNTKTIENDGDTYANYRQFDVTFNETGSPRLYLRGDQGDNANPANDRFLLFTENSEGVSFEFDISWDVVPTELLNENNEVDLKLIFFNADQSLGGGYGYYSDHILVPYSGVGVWEHVVVDMYQTRVGSDSFMYNTDVPEASSRHMAPNNCRIIGIMFQGAYNSGAPLANMVVNFDNIKFVISGE
ncbi:MAG: IPT/TIG domain-containing protein [Salinivirgaceae bacterium]